MGSYLSQPITTKTTESGVGGGTQYGVASMQGWRKTQEDAHLAVAGFGNSVHRNSSLFGVFDGHGGPEVAKFCAKHLFEELQLQDDFQKGDFEASLAQSFHRMDDMLRDAANTDEIENLKHINSEGDGDDGPVSGGPAEALELLRKMFQVKRLEDNKDGGWHQDGDNAAYQELASGAKVGCTAVVAFKHQRSLYVASAGDSRCVLSRAGKAIALSEDHKPSQEREKSRIIAAGGFLSDIGSVCRVNGNLNLSRAIGDLQYKGNPHLSKKEQIITAEPDVTGWELTEEDEFLVLACDGVWDVKGNQEVVDFVRQRLLEEGQKPTEVVCALLDACLATDPKEAKGIGCDNMTCIIAKLEV